MLQATKRLSLLTIGEIGRTADLSGYPNLRTALTEALGSSSEDIKSAASTALGAVCIGNLGAYMPFLLQQIRALVRFNPAPHTATAQEPGTYHQQAVCSSSVA